MYNFKWINLRENWHLYCGVHLSICSWFLLCFSGAFWSFLKCKSWILLLNLPLAMFYFFVIAFVDRILSFHYSFYEFFFFFCICEGFQFLKINFVPRHITHSTVFYFSECSRYTIKLFERNFNFVFSSFLIFYIWFFFLICQKF